MNDTNQNNNQNPSKKEQPSKPETTKPAIPERPKPNVIHAQKSANDTKENRSGNNSDG